MKFTLSWLKDHLDTAAALDEIVTKLTMIGLEVEAVEDRGAPLKPFIVAEIKKAEPHPNADRLRVCEVWTGETTLSVVCGAPNARAALKVALARPGDVIPSTGQALKAGVIRGVESQGMLCSAEELGLPEASDGIIELAATAIPGQSLVELLGLNDPLIDINLTPNRADCAGVRGIARDLAAAGLGTLKPLTVSDLPGSFKSPIGVTIAAEAENACPLFVGRVIRNLRNAESPAWLKERLLAIGLRPISALVDITNYFTFDLGRPLHVFDADKLNGDLFLHFTKSGEIFEALNGKTYELQAGYLAIADKTGIEALAGVMGGAATGCQETTSTIFLEVALFDPGAVARTGRDLQIHSDARYRFERGVDPAFLFDAAALAAQMILDLCGGEASELVTAGLEPAWQRTISLRSDRVKTLGGFDVPADRQTAILQRLGFTVTGSEVTPPSWRGDIEGEADLVEEILRIVGYDQIPTLPLSRPSAITKSAVTAAQKRLSMAKRILAARGLNEAVTFSFLSSQKAKLFGEIDPSLVLLNPISTELDVMRQSIVPNLVEAVIRNASRSFYNTQLFEVGPVYSSSGQAQTATIVRSGIAVLKGWTDEARPVDVFDVKADAIALLAQLGLSTENLITEVAAPSWYHPGRSGVLKLGPKVLANFGELHPQILADLSCSQPIAAAEIFFDALPPQKRKGTERPLLKLSPFQALERDFAFVVNQTVSADQVIKAIKTADKIFISAATIFDIYQGPGIQGDKKSLGVSVTLQPIEQTLAETDIEAITNKIVVAVAAETGATLRS